MDIATSFLFKRMPRFFCTMINKWNLSRETTQMACPISFRTESPAVTWVECVSPLFGSKYEKYVLLNFSKHWWADSLPVNHDLLAKRSFYQLTSNLWELSGCHAKIALFELCEVTHVVKWELLMLWKKTRFFVRSVAVDWNGCAVYDVSKMSPEHWFCVMLLPIMWEEKRL